MPPWVASCSVPTQDVGRDVHQSVVHGPSLGQWAVMGCQLQIVDWVHPAPWMTLILAEGREKGEQDI